MPILLTSKTVRIALNAGSYGGFTDQLTNGPVKFPFADLRIEAGLFYGKTNTTLTLVDLANIVSLTCTIKAVGAGDTAPAPAAGNLMQAVVLAEDFNAGLTAEQWAALTGCHVAFDFSEAQVNNIPAAGKVWVVFTALLNTGKVIPIQFGMMEVVEDGYASAGVEPAVQNTSYTKAESDALYAREFLAPMIFAGELADEQAFGYFKARSACRVIGAQLFAQIAPTGAAVTVDLIDGAAAEQTKIATLADGASVQETIYGAPLVLAAGDIIRAKLKTVGSTEPGEFLTCNLIIAPTI